MPFTEAEIQAYVKCGGVRCPSSACRSSHIKAKLFPHTDGGVAWHSCSCEKCGIEWNDIYTLTGIEEK